MRPALIALASLALASPAAATTPVALTLKDHRFEPAEIVVPAGQKIEIRLDNKDGSADEFDSLDLMVEEDVTPHGQVKFTVGPLPPGAYSFQGEMHPKTAQGRLVVR